MISRRRLLVGVPAAILASSANSTPGLTIDGYERGDPETEDEHALINNAYLRGDLEGAKPLLPDAIKHFPDRLADAAIDCLGVNRWDESSTKISEWLNSFGCPFSQTVGSKTAYTAFCAAGIGFVAGSLYAHIQGNKKVGRLDFRVVDYHHFWPSSAVRDMANVANGKGRWVKEGTADKQPKRGWIVCFNWDARKDAAAVNHCGIVIEATKTELCTIEFNTSATVDGNQRNGGVVAIRTRSRNSTVKGYIVTETLK